MRHISVNDISLPNISISLNEETEDSILIIFNGDIDMKNPQSILDPFFEDIHKQVVQFEKKSVTCDLANLYFLNSSGIKSFVKWVIALQKLPQEKQYTIKIKTNHDISWQSSSLKSFTYLAPGLIIIE